MTIKSIRRNSLKVFGILTMIALVVGAGVFMQQTRPVSAASEEINVSTFDFTADSSGTNWSYAPVGASAYYSDLTITGPITLTGTGTYNSSGRSIRILGDYPITFDNLNLTFVNNDYDASYVLRIHESTQITLVGTNTLTNASVPPAGSNNWIFGLALRRSTVTPTTFDGSGTLNINLDTTNSQVSRGIENTNGDIVFADSTTINIKLADNTHTNNTSYGILSSSGKVVLKDSARLSVDIGRSIFQTYGINSMGINFDGGGSISVAVSDNSTGIVKTIANPIGGDTRSSNRYAWIVSENNSGTPVDASGVWPTNNFNTIISAANDYRNVKLVYKGPNSQVGATAITAPTANQFVNPEKGFTISGTIDDVDDDTWDVDVALVANESDVPSSWTSCVDDTATRAFTCEYNGPTIADGTVYLKLKVSDAPSNPSDSTSYTSTISLKVDTTAPTSPGISTTPAVSNNQWTNEPSYVLELTPGTDTGGSGVKRTAFKVYAEGVPSVSNDNYSVPTYLMMTEGEIEIEAYTYDNVDNQSALSSLTFYVDHTTPTISHSLSGGTLVSGSTYSAPPSVELTATDPKNANNSNGSGINAIEYDWLLGDVPAASCTFGSTESGSSKQLTAPTTPDTYTLCYRTSDIAGNVSATGTLTLTIIELTPQLPDTTTGIVVEHLGNGFASDQYLVINEIDKSQRDLSATGQEALAIYDIMICSTNNNPCAPITAWNDNLRITIPLNGVTSGYTNISLFSLDTNLSPVAHGSTISGDQLIFETDHLSEWAIAGSRIPATNPIAPIVPGAPNTGVCSLFVPTEKSFGEKPSLQIGGLANRR